MMAPEDRPATLEEAAREELVHLWYDLCMAQRNAIRTDWSIQCEGLADRIEALTRFVGPAPWERIQIPLLENGVYQRLHAEWGIGAPVDMQRVAQTRANIDARLARL